uniref:Importin-5-like isoform X1 n=1 Tax=Nicotiana tabacum TaxID=4097 RepID=A0A1S3YI62_TOBAC|nr:PREDICTED: importin-5-like isoform X1 [Nicotiana tabacum]XP_016451942.1 PREDICTED: importin-5-like isoform X1 [Nicotiana tabacum]XP_016451943.1 PREDICTED: importin-5-like isoform X1 [Nicotiana tabacum]
MNISELTQFQKAQMKAILGPDSSVPFETFISDLMASSSEAESMLDMIKQEDSNLLAVKLANLLDSPHITDDSRATCAIVLQNLFVGDDGYGWRNLSLSTRSGVQCILLNRIKIEESKSIMQTLYITLCVSLQDNKESEICSLFGQYYDNSSYIKVVEFTLSLVSQCAKQGDDLSSAPWIKDMLLGALNGCSDMRLRMAALRAAIDIIQCLSSSNDKDWYQGLLPALLGTLTEALSKGEEVTAREALEHFVEFAENEPRFLRMQLVEVVATMFEIAENVSLEKETRHLAIKFLITLVEAKKEAPGMMKKLPLFTSNCFAMLLKLLQDVEDEPPWNNIHKVAFREYGNIMVGICYFDRLSRALGAKTIAPVAKEQLSACLAAPDWEKRHATLLALAVISECCPKVMLTSMEELVLNYFLNMVLDCFQDPHPRVRWAAIRAIALFSTFFCPQLQEQFHDQVLPALAAAMADFQNPIIQVMEVLLSLLGSQLKADDRSNVYLFLAGARIFLCMGKEFLPYMRVAIPFMIQLAQVELDITIYDHSYSGLYGLDYDRDIIVKFEETSMCIKDNIRLEEKSIACHLLDIISVLLEEDFYPWISQAAPVLEPLLKFYIHDDVRENAIFAISSLLRSAKLAVEKGTAQGGNKWYFKELSGRIILALGDAIYSEHETKLCEIILKELNQCLKISGPHLDEDQVRRIMNGIKHVITESSCRKGKLTEREKSDDFDAEEAELLREERELEEKVFSRVGCILLTLIKTFKAAFLPFLNELSSYLMPMTGKDKTAKERSACVNIFNKLVEECSESSLKYYNICLPFILDSSNDENPVLRENAFYGLGLCAEYGGLVFKPFIGEALSRINVVITHLHALAPENEQAYHDAVFALGQICQFHRESIDSTQIIPAWLNCLPIRGNMVVHDQLCSMVERYCTGLICSSFYHHLVFTLLFRFSFC